MKYANWIHSAIEVCAIALAISPAAHAVDSFNPTNKQLHLDAVTMNGVTYRDVVATLHSYTLMGVTGVAGMANTFDPASNTLVLGAVTYQGSTFNGVTAKINSYTLGGGGSDPTLNINAANAKAVAANALSQSTNGLIVLAGGAPLIDNTAFLLPTLNFLNSSIINANTLKAKVQTCGAGGSVRVSGSVASTAGLGAGDTVNSDYQYCMIFNAGSSPVFVSGTAAQTVTSGSAYAMPFQIVLASSFNNLNTGLLKTFGVFTETDLLNGDEKLEWNATSTTSQSLTASGTSMSNKSTVGAVVRTHVWQNYQQTTAINGANTSLSFTGLVQSDNTNLSPTGGTYSLTTPTAIVKTTTTGVLSAGVIKAVGTSNSAVLVTLGANGAVTLQVDANGDGTFETTIATTLTELNTFL